MMNRFKDKVVAITGGSDGIGLATAKRFASEGAYVYFTGRRQELLDAAATEIGNGAIGIQGDVCNASDLDRLYERIANDHGRLDVVFANAGLSESIPLGQIDEAHIDRLFDTNFKGLIFTVQKALPLMEAGGTVILAGSGAASKGFPALSIYSAMKAAIRSLARTWTTDLRGRGIRVNVVTPGVILTGGMHTYLSANPGAEETMKQMTPLGRGGEPDEVATGVLFLASEDSSFMTGSELVVDGGFVTV
jgi:NAD(P)-dependent dehydrogenase (short-subunit alcohol dehydrogenase family)